MPLLGTAAMQLGMQAASGAINEGMGLLFANAKNKKQLEQQKELQRLQLEGQKEMTDYQYGKQKQMWEETGYSAQRRQMEQAGINPALMYGMGGGGGQTTGTASGNVTGGSAGLPQASQGDTGMGIQLQLLKAQKDLLESQAIKNKAEAEKISGVETANIAADTENKILQRVLIEYTGKESKDTYEKITAPNRLIQAKTYEEELSARQGVAGTIYELWTEGKLKDKSIAEIEQILLNNAKTREETRRIYKDMEMIEQNIKGAKLDNIMKELESQLQTETGIDRNSPAWLKILGRLFVQLTNQ